ncbi:MAG: glycosyltransferase, partial [Campylobacterales bacterium]|nr:glycosyltransferase [Campylobacterales bacterium]
VIYNPVAKHIEDYAKTHDLSQVEKQDYLLCVGRLEKQKAFHYAIVGFAGVANEFPNLRLKIVGKGSQEGELKNQADELGVGDRIDFEGYQTDMISYYLGAKVTLLTSLYEGFPNVLVESIALGTPVVAFDCPSGPSEIVVSGVNGFLVPYKEEVALTTEIRKALDLDWRGAQVALTAETFRADVILTQYERELN